MAERQKMFRADAEFRPDLLNRFLVGFARNSDIGLNGHPALPEFLSVVLTVCDRCAVDRTMWRFCATENGSRMASTGN
jgi:hypothetical protein